MLVKEVIISFNDVKSITTYTEHPLLSTRQASRVFQLSPRGSVLEAEDRGIRWGRGFVWIIA
jgi:hypothetical protein